MKPAKDSRVRVSTVIAFVLAHGTEIQNWKHLEATTMVQVTLIMKRFRDSFAFPQSRRDSLGFTMIFPFIIIYLILSHSPIFIKGSIGEHIFPNWFHHQHLQQEKTVSVGKGFCTGKSSCFAWTGPSNTLDNLYNPIPFHNWYFLFC